MSPDLPDPRPRYNTAAPAEWEPVSPPPYDFLGVTMRVFPLQADLRRLDRFCDQYLNLMPREIAFFRPALPTVFLVLLDYGKMVSEARNVGWVSQRETGFIVPLLWMREKGGEETFVDWAAVAPYIWVDQPMSITTGREIYGWPKERGWFIPGTDAWTDVGSDEPFRFRLDTKVRPRLPPALGSGIRTLFTIREEPPPELFAWPPNPGSIWNPFRTVSNLLKSSETLVNGMVGVWASLVRTTLETGSGAWGPSSRLAAEMLGALWPLTDATQLPNPRFNTINLKQFRHSQDPRDLCYQALTNARMVALRYGRTELLGTPALTGGDPSGGFHIEIDGYSAYPVVERLGLLTHTAPRSDRHHLRPLFPMEVEMDLRYDQGEVVCWRSEHHDWSESGKPGPPISQPAPYNSTLGKHEAPLPGPFAFPDVTWRVMPLEADPVQLQKLTDALINDLLEKTGGGAPFRAPFPWVLLAAVHYCNVRDEGCATEPNCWCDRELSFWVPLERKTEDGGSEIWFNVPSLFANDEVAVITLREVLGLPAVQGDLTCPRGVWMSPYPPPAEPLLRLHTEVVTSVETDVPQSVQVVLEIVREPQPTARTGPETREPKKAAALERVTRQLRSEGLLRIVTLKQFRDVHDPQLACYQSIVEESARIDIRHHGDLEDGLALRVYSYPSQPLISTLGLRVTETQPGAPSGQPPPVDLVSPYGGFWLQGALRRSADRTHHVYPTVPPEIGEETR